MAELKRKYGLFTAMCMVVGVVIGSGVFFKAEKMLSITKGDLPVALLAWVIGGIVMVISGYTFAVMGSKYEKVNGLVDYAEALVGPRYAYMTGWFMATIYYPAMTSALAWLSARYTMSLFGYGAASAETMTLAAVYLIMSFAINTLSPKLAGTFQVSTTVIKLIPLLLMAIVGTFYGLKTHTTLDNFNSVVNEAGQMIPRVGISWNLILKGVCTSVFAYEGWIVATTINAELKDSKKNLPRALVLGTIIVVSVYLLYYLGISGSVSTADLLSTDESGNTLGAGYAFRQMFGSIAGTILTVFIAVSCLGTLNGLTLGCGRGFYSLAARNCGPSPRHLSKIDEATHMPSNAGIVALLFNILWMFYFYMANLTDIPTKVSGFGANFLFDSTELPLICVYTFYFPIYIMFIIKGKGLNPFKRIAMPVLSIFGSILFIYAAIDAHGTKNIGFIIIFAIIMIIGACMYRKSPSEGK